MQCLQASSEIEYSDATHAEVRTTLIGLNRHHFRLTATI